MMLYISVICLLQAIAVYSSDGDNKIASARIESCGGWQLNRLPEVKRFIYRDLPLFHNVEFKQISGAVPELIFLNKAGKEIERIPLSEKNQLECRQLLIIKGFYMKKSEDEVVPDKYKDAPFTTHLEL